MSKFIMNILTALGVLTIVVSSCLVGLSYGYTKPPFKTYTIGACAYALSERVLTQVYSYKHKRYDAGFEKLYNSNHIGMTKSGEQVTVTAIGKGAPQYGLLATVRMYGEDGVSVWTDASCVH